MKRGNMDSQKSKIGHYLIQMPCDKIAAICVMHLMKHLLSQFSKDNSHFNEDFSLLKNDENIEKSEFKIQAITLFQELGKLFDQELKMNKGKSDKSIEEHLLIDDHSFGALPKDT